MLRGHFCIVCLFVHNRRKTALQRRLALCVWELRPGRPLVRIQSGAPRRNGLCSIQKAQPKGWAFFMPLRHSSSSPENPASRAFPGAPAFCKRHIACDVFLQKTSRAHSAAPRFPTKFCFANFCGGPKKANRVSLPALFVKPPAHSFRCNSPSPDFCKRHTACGLFAQNRRACFWLLCTGGKDVIIDALQ